jgi:hypothetical protein
MRVDIQVRPIERVRHRATRPFWMFVPFTIPKRRFSDVFAAARNRARNALLDLFRK